MTTVSPKARVAIPADVVWRDVDGEIVLLNVTTGLYFGLDGTASRVWRLIGDGAALAAICEQLAGEYDIDRPTIDADVSSLVGDLLAHQLLSLTP